MAKDDDSAIPLNSVLPAIDRKDYDWYDALTAKQKEKFSSWLYMRYTSVVAGDPDLMRYYLMSTNIHVNKHFSSLRKHPKLQYLLMVAAAPGLGVARHTFLPPGKKNAADSDDARVRLFAKFYPEYSEQELTILTQINTDEDLRQHMIELGMSDKEIKAVFKGLDE